MEGGRGAAPHLRVLGAEDWAVWRELRLLALRESPYAFASRYADWAQAPEGRWRERLLAADLNVVAELDGRAAGMASGRRDGATAELFSLYVAPWARGRGVGDALVRSVLDWAGDLGLSATELTVRDGNRHAFALYRRHGFVDAGPAPDMAQGAPPGRRLRRTD